MEPWCTFVAPPPRLLRHLADAHFWPSRGIAYGKVLRVSLSEPHRLVLADDDGCVFVLGAHRRFGCVCQSVDGVPRYTAVLHASGPPLPSAAADITIMVAMETVMRSERPGEVAMENLPSSWSCCPRIR